MAYTYICIPAQATSDVTTHHVLQMMKTLRTHNMNVNLEGITEGGLVFASDGTEAYKTLRFAFYPYRWPWIKPDSEKAWAEEPPVLLFSKRLLGSITLKAFHGAPVWTLEELKVVKLVLGMGGLRVYTSKITGKDLKWKPGDQGYDPKLGNPDAYKTMSF